MTCLNGQTNKHKKVHKMICKTDPHCLGTKEIVYLTLIITVVLYLSGLFTVNFVNHYPAWLQNMIYAVGRIPFVFGVLYFALRKE